MLEKKNKNSPKKNPQRNGIDRRRKRRSALQSDSTKRGNKLVKPSKNNNNDMQQKLGTIDKFFNNETCGTWPIA